MKKVLLFILVFCLGVGITLVLKVTPDNTEGYHIKGLMSFAFNDVPGLEYLTASGSWKGSDAETRIEGENFNTTSIECYIADKICTEALVYDTDANYLMYPVIIDYIIESVTPERVVARRDGGAAVLILDISRSSKIVQKERIEPTLTKKWLLVSGDDIR